MKSIKVNFLMNVVLTMSSFVFPLITFPYVSRILEADGLGKIQMATSFVAYFLMVSQLGLPTYGIRTCAAVRDDKLKLSRTVHELLIIQVVMTIIAYGAFFACVLFIHKLRQEKLLYLISSLVILLNTVGVEWLFKALEQYTYITIRSIIFKAISVAAMLACVHSKSDYELYAAISVLASSGSNVVNLAQVHKYVSLKPVGAYDIRQHIRPVVVLFAYVCATTIYTNLDSVMLGFLTTEADVGYYSVAIKIKNILVSVVTALGVVLLPRVSYYFEQGLFDEFWKMAIKAMRFVLLLAVPLTVFFMFYAGNGVAFLSGEGYESSVLPMIVIMPTLICIGVTSVTGVQILIPTKRENIVLCASIMGAIADLLINALLIPQYRSTGAAIGTLIAEFAVMLVHLFSLRHELKDKMESMSLTLIVCATMIASSTVPLTRFLHAGNFLTLIVGAMLFFSVYLIVLVVGKEPFVIEIADRVFSKLSRKQMFN